MIDIQTALYNLMHARYGQQVRQSLHDAVYQINENANEALQTAKAMGVGTAVTSASSSSTGYVAGNLYLNNSTWDLWQCIGTNSWLNCGNVKGAQGNRGTDGTSYYVYIRYSPNYDGTDFTASPTASSQYVGFYSGTSATAPTNKQDYAWTSYVGASGTSAYVHIMYSENADGSNFVSTPTANTKYIGFYSGTASSAPANKSLYTWSEYVGRSGTGTGDMLKSEFAGSGVVGAVDRALTADSATDSTNASNLKKSDNTTVSADDITAKLSSIDSNGKVSADNIKSGTSAKSNAELTETLSTYSNPNLIDNPFFAINSKGQSSYSGGTTRVYTFDKWFFNPNNTISITKNSNGSFTLQNLSSAVYGICQEFTNKLDKGKEYTFTIDTNDYSNISSIAFYNNTSSWTLQTTVNPTPKATFTNTFDIGLMAIYIKANSSITFNSVKLELGGKSTLSNDISFNEGFTPSTISNELSVENISSAFNQTASQYINDIRAIKYGKVVFINGRVRFSGNSEVLMTLSHSCLQYAPSQTSYVRVGNCTLHGGGGAKTLLYDSINHQFYAQTNFEIGDSEATEYDYSITYIIE